MTPVFLVITKLKGYSGRFTPVEPAVNLLKRFNIKMAFEVPKLINLFSSFLGKSSQ